MQKPLLKLYNDAEQAERCTIELPVSHREQLFRLKGYLEGIGAPKVMQESFNDLLDLAIGPGMVVGNARFDR